MSGTWFGLEIARRGLQVHQNTLNITGHNLANASTPGYSRQEAVLNATAPYTTPSLGCPAPPGQLGTGVEISSIRRIRDEYLDHQVRRAVTDTAYWEDQISVFQRAEASFAEPASSGIGDRIVDFFKAWQDLNNSPQDPGVKASVVQIGDELASLMSYTYNQLTDVQNSVAMIVETKGQDDEPNTYGLAGGQLQEQVAEANSLLTQIRDLTGAIEKIYISGQQPNDLLDQRDLLLEELSKFGPLTVKIDPDKGKPTGGLELDFFGIDVMTGDAKLRLDLVEPTDDEDSEGGENGVDAGEGVCLYVCLYVENGGTGDKIGSINLTDNCNDTDKGGSLLGLERARQNLATFKDHLNDLATSMRDAILAVNEEPPSAELTKFFIGDLVGDPVDGSFRVKDELLSNPALLDGTKAKDISSLRGKNIDEGEKRFTFEEYYSLLLTKVGGSAKSAADIAGNQSAISKQITALRDSVSGVLIDEELTKMLQFQYGYQASARVVNVMDSMLDTLINRLF